MPQHPLFNKPMFYHHPLLFKLEGKSISNEPEAMSVLNPAKISPNSGARSTLHGGVIDALYAMAMKKLTLLNLGSGTYSCEEPMTLNGTPLGTYVLSVMSQNGEFKAATVNPSIGMQCQPLPPVGQKLLDGIPCEAIYAPLIMLVAEQTPPVLTDAELVINAFEKGICLDEGTATHPATKESIAARMALFRVCDAVYYAVQNGSVKPKIDNGNIDIMNNASLAAGAYGSNNVVKGYKPPVVICGVVDGSAGKSSRPKTIGEAKRKYEKFRDAQNIPEEDRKYIPQFPDEYPFPPEVDRIATKYVGTMGSKMPMVNFMWRGVTGYGKSTGVELLAAALGLPLLRITCHSSMEAQDFLAQFVPNTDHHLDSVSLPTFEEMLYDPEGSYEQLTGVSKEGASSQECLAAYGEAVARQSGDNHGKSNLFKLVTSDFVMALVKGYIVEVQELSTIRDAGVMVSLNEYDRPGAIIPLVDGRKVKRHERAMVVYTDNPGYAGRHKLDQAVVRRFRMVIDSYELDKKDVIARVKYNTGFDDDVILEGMYELWKDLQKFCKQHDYTEGDTSFMGLMDWAMAVKADNMANMRENCLMCLVAKATSDMEEQQKIITGVLDKSKLFKAV